MSTIQFRVEDRLKQQAYQAFEELDITPSDAMRLLLQYVAENRRLPFVNVMIADVDNDDDIIAIAKERLLNPSKRIRINIDDL